MKIRNPRISQNLGGTWVAKKSKIWSPKLKNVVKKRPKFGQYLPVTKDIHLGDTHSEPPETQAEPLYPLDS